MEQFFNNLSDELLEASNHVATRFEEGLSVLLNGRLPEDTGGEQDGAPSPSGHQYSQKDLEEMDIDHLSDEEIDEILKQQSMEFSPLEGIADSVIGDIVSRQVSR